MISLAVGPAELRALEPWHATEFAGLFRTHGADFYEWLPWEHLEDEERARAFLQSFADGAAADSRRILGLWLEESLVGFALFPSFNPKSGVAEIGVGLAAPARGQGLITRAVEAMVEWCFSERGMHRVEWRCAPDNEASRAVARRLGFTHEGTLREAFTIGERRVDLEMWSLLRHDPEWLSRSGR